MKRVLLFFIITLSAVGLSAQMKVDNDMLIYSNPNPNYCKINDVVITGVLTTRALPCFDEECPDMDVIAVSNDTASFVLSRGEQYLGSLSEVGDFSFGDIVSICGSIWQKQEYNGQCFYELLVKAILKDISQSHFSANCKGEIGDENQSTSPVLTVENDSVIIKFIQYEQCCAEYALRVSDPINDTVYINFTDTAKAECDCMCNYEVRISLKKPEFPMSYFCMLNFSTYVLDFNNLIFNNTIIYENSTWVTLSYVYNIYPNPVDDVLTISCVDNTIARVEIFDISGEKIYSQTHKNNINVSSLAKGLYILKVYDTNEQVAMFKFIKKSP